MCKVFKPTFQFGPPLLPIPFIIITFLEQFSKNQQVPRQFLFCIVFIQFSTELKFEKTHYECFFEKNQPVILENMAPHYLGFHAFQQRRSGFGSSGFCNVQPAMEGCEFVAQLFIIHETKVDFMVEVNNDATSFIVSSTSCLSTHHPL